MTLIGVNSVKSALFGVLILVLTACTTVDNTLVEIHQYVIIDDNNIDGIKEKKEKYVKQK